MKTLATIEDSINFLYTSPRLTSSHELGAIGQERLSQKCNQYCALEALQTIS